MARRGPGGTLPASSGRGSGSAPPRRDRLTAISREATWKEQISVPKRALIVIDVQNEYFDGALPISDPPPETSLANVGRAMDAATTAGVT